MNLIANIAKSAIKTIALSRKIAIKLIAVQTGKVQVTLYKDIKAHWHKLDEDVSFESFTYDEAEPSAFQKFFLEHPEINIAEFSKAIGLNPSLMRNYINGFKKPSKEREKLILDYIHKLGKIYSEVSFAS